MSIYLGPDFLNFYLMYKPKTNIKEEKFININIPLFEKPENVKNEGLWYLSESIKLLSEADVFVGMSCPYDYTGCNLETAAARGYDIPIVSIPNDYIFTKKERKKFK